MSLLNVYQAAITKGQIEDDPLQRDVIAQLQIIIDKLAIQKPSWFRRPKPIKGFYLQGSVGAGKTYLMDLFYDYLPETRKSRLHFHQFMQKIDAQLRVLQGQKNPLRLIAAEWARHTKVLCLDEFLVEDVTHAMVLVQLLEALLAHNMTLIITSNTLPDDLYRNGPQRERFLPAINMLKQHCLVWTLPARRDYRLGKGKAWQAYFYPLNAKNKKAFANQFTLVAPHALKNENLLIQNRNITCVQHQDKAVWFEFSVLCHVPRSQLDYLEITQRFDTIFISNIPCLGEHHTQQMVLFMRFIDVAYDKKIRLVLWSEVPLDELYTHGPLVHGFQRTLSRLVEMQSEGYWQGKNS